MVVKIGVTKRIVTADDFDDDPEGMGRGHTRTRSAGISLRRNQTEWSPGVSGLKRDEEKVTREVIAQIATIFLLWHIGELQRGKDPAIITTPDLERVTRMLRALPEEDQESEQTHWQRKHMLRQ
jgi:hypothetical protein